MERFHFNEEKGVRALRDISVRDMIRTLIDVEVSTDDMDELKTYPEKYVSSEAEAETLKMLFDFVEMTKEIQHESGK